MNRMSEILGYCLVNHELLNDPNLTPELFFAGLERSIFLAAKKLKEETGDVDWAELARLLAKHENVAGMITKLTDGTHRLDKKNFQTKVLTARKSAAALQLVNAVKDTGPAIVKEVDPNFEALDMAARKYISDMDSFLDGREITFETLTSFLNRELPPRKIIADPILALLEIVMLHGIPKVGKTLLLLMLARCLAEGRDWLSFKVLQAIAPILFIQFEVSHSQMQERTSKIFATAAKETTDNVIVPEIRRNLYVTQQSSRAYLSQLFSEVKPAIIFIDPYEKMFPDEETAMKNPRGFFDFFREEIDKHNFALVFCHHDGKFQEGKIGGQRSLGSTFISSNADASWNMRRFLNSGLSVEEFDRTTELSFESRNWQPRRPLTIRRNDELSFDVVELKQSSASKWDIIEMIRDAGGKAEQKEIIKRFTSVKMFERAKDAALEAGLINEVELGGRGSPIALFLSDTQNNGE